MSKKPLLVAMPGLTLQKLPPPSTTARHDQSLLLKTSSMLMSEPITTSAQKRKKDLGAQGVGATGQHQQIQSVFQDAIK